jgi:O-antigen ligase
LGKGSIGTGRIGGVAALIALFYFLTSKTVLRKFVSLLAALVGLLTMFFSGTRGASIAFILAFLPLYFYVRSATLFKQIVTAVLITSAIITTIALTPEDITSRWQQLSSVENVSEMTRVPIYKNALMMIAEAPVYGNGIGSFYDKYGTWPHNIFLEMLVEFGVVGAIWFLYFLALTIQKVRKFIKDTSISRVDKQFMMMLFCGFIFFLIGAQVSGDIPGNSAIWLFSGIIYGYSYAGAGDGHLSAA